MRTTQRYSLIGALALILSIVGINANNLFSLPFFNLKPASDSASQVDKTLHGKVIKVADGDTITLKDNHGTTHRIRLLGVDAPELQQAHGQAAKKWLSELILDNSIQVQVVDQDRYERLIGKLKTTPSTCQKTECEYSVDLNLQLVQLGHAWWYSNYKKNQPKTDHTLYEQAQTFAQNNKLGLWEKPNPVPPWQWRKNKQ